ncbi:MAG: carbohydrate binding domain-containing protein [Ilumatobacteraceae bacterium]
MARNKVSRSLLCLVGAFAFIAAACGSESTTETTSDDETLTEATDGDPGESADAEDSSGTASPDEEQAVEKSEEEMQTVDDFESYTAGDELPESWSVYGNAAGDIVTVSPGDDLSTEGQEGDNQLLSWSFDANADPGFGGIRTYFSEPQNWTGFTGIQFLYFGGGEGGELQIEIGEDRTAGDLSDVERYRTRSFFDRTKGWQLIRLPFESFSPARFNPEPGNGVLDAIAVDNLVVAANSGTSGEGVAIDDIALYFDGTVYVERQETPEIAAGPEVVDSLDDFENYEGSSTVPATWFNYGNAGGGVSIITVDDARARDGQSAENKVLAWGFDADSDPGYGGVGKEFAEPLNWTGYTGLEFWFKGSGEGGELQIEIGEDKSSDVERYRAPAFYDRETDWQRIRLPFSSFRPGDYNPVPGNGILDLKAVYNIVFAANSGASTEGVAIDEVAVYSDGTTSVSSPTGGEVVTGTEIDYEAIPLLPAPEPVAPVAPPGMELVWSDEFDGDEINLDNWRFDQGGWGWGNGESQFYTDRPQNARVSDGMLVIEAWEEEYLGSYYTSARLLSQGLQEFQYGRIEARLNVPAGKGTWPAFWMLGTGFEHFAEDPARRWPNVGEIDIMEFIGREPDLVLGTIHGPGYAGAGGKSRWYRQDFDVSDDWHTYAIEWDETGISWFFDGENYATVGPENIKRGEWVFDRPFFMLLNLAIGGTLGGYLDPELEFPLRYYVDYVRVYQ